MTKPFPMFSRFKPVTPPELPLGCGLGLRVLVDCRPLRRVLQGFSTEIACAKFALGRLLANSPPFQESCGELEPYLGSWKSYQYQREFLLHNDAGFKVVQLDYTTPPERHESTSADIDIYI